MKYYKTRDGDVFYKLEGAYLYVFFPSKVWRFITEPRHVPNIPEITRIVNTKYGKIKYRYLLEAENKEW